MSNNPTKTKKALTAAVVLLTLSLILNIVLLILLIGYKPEGGTAYQPGSIGFDPDASDKRPGSVTQSQSVTVAGFSKLTIPPDTDTVAIDLYNPEENFGLYYMTFELRLLTDDGGYETLYTSGLVGAGKHIYQITLSHALAAGEYSAVLFIQPYRMADMSTTNNVAGNITLIVK